MKNDVKIVLAIGGGAAVLGVIAILLLRRREVEPGDPVPGDVPGDDPGEPATIDLSGWDPEWGPIRTSGLRDDQEDFFRTLPNYRDAAPGLGYPSRAAYYATLWEAWDLVPETARAILVAHASYAGGRPFPPKDLRIKGHNNLGLMISPGQIGRGWPFYIAHSRIGLGLCMRYFETYRSCLTDGLQENLARKAPGMWNWIMGQAGLLVDGLPHMDRLCAEYVHGISHWFSARDQAQLDRLAQDFAWIVRNKVAPML